MKSLAERVADGISHEQIRAVIPTTETLPPLDWVDNQDPPEESSYSILVIFSDSVDGPTRDTIRDMLSEANPDSVIALETMGSGTVLNGEHEGNSFAAVHIDA